MSLDEKFIPVQTSFYEMVDNFFQQIAKFFGYPENPGMPYDVPNGKLPTHQTFWPPIQRPETWFEMVFGPAPKIEAVPKYFYETNKEGFYNFYIENYTNIYFLPDWVSEFFQIRLNLCLDITLLETIREVLFVGLMIYSQIVVLRIALSWYISINPYTFPWYYLTAAVDWTEDVLQGIVPAILGVNITGSIFLGIIGVIGDSLNHLVFTMPFLPSEGEETKAVLNEQLKDVLVFHYLPILWYRYPIPNDIREFWYTERPDILNYMQTAYKDLDIQFLPDKIIQELNRQNLKTELSQIHHYLIPQNNHLTNDIPTEILSNQNISQVDVLVSSIISLPENLDNFLLTDINKLFF